MKKIPKDTTNKGNKKNISANKYYKQGFFY